MVDPDLGAETYNYDQNGNMLQTANARGGSGTIYAGYDGLNRQLWRSINNTPTGASLTNTYDSTAGGNQGTGRRTGEAFSGTFSGSYAYTYDARGQVTNTSSVLGGNTYPLSATYNDAGQILTQTYPTGETVTNAYTSQGWLASLTRTLSGTTTTLANNLAYTGPGGASGAITSAQLGNSTYNETFGYDNGLRLTGVTLTKLVGGATLFISTPTYDAVNNVMSVATTLPGGTDNQGFCYDEQDRLTWAATSGTKPCGGTVSAGTLSSAAYAQTFGYDNLNRLTNGPAGTYTYGDSAHLHAATAVGTGYTASYDAAGNMTCRAPTSSQTCSGTITGAKLTYDNEGRLKAWQNAQTSPTATESVLYDGEHNRVKQESVVNGTTTTTVYVGGVEEVKTSGGVTTTTTYYMLGGQRIALAVNGTLSYLASDLLGSTTVALDGAGNVTASQLYAPYGTNRYSSGTMPTDRGFTGQHTDAVTGLDYYNARYYDPAIGLFSSADVVLDGLNRYAYVGNNPETKVDPTGNMLDTGGGGGSGETHGDGCTVTRTCGGLYYEPRPRPQPKPQPKPRIYIPGRSAGFGTIRLLRDKKNLADFGFDGNSPNSCGMFNQTDCGGYGVLYAVYTPYGQFALPGVWNCIGDACDKGGDSSKSESELEDASYFERACGLSFSADTPVETPDGEHPIGSLKVGDKVIAYDPETGQSSEQTVEHVWLNHDDDLLDVTLRNDDANQVSAPSLLKDQRMQVAAHRMQISLTTMASDETIQTTEKHPWLTVDKGWLKAGELQVGEQVVRLDGATATVTMLHERQGEQAYYYNLTVSRLHTYAVGSGRVVVHNSCIGDRLPAYKKGAVTEGYLVVDGKETYLYSGYPGPQLKPGTPGARLNINSSRHVEAQAAALMREGGITKAELWINHDPCPGTYGCGNALQHMLPEGAQLDLYVKKPNGWDHTTIIGKPDADYTGP